MRIILFVFLIHLTTLFANAQTIPIDKSNTYPGYTWEYLKDPSALGWNKEKLQSLKEFIIDSANTTGMMVIQHGKVIFTYGDVKEVSYIASCRKSILSMLYGPFVARGEIKLDQTLEQLNINDVGGLLPLERKATVKDLLTSRSGVYHVASYQGDEYPIAPNRGTVKPGSLFLYNNWDFNLAGYVFEQQTKTNIYDALESILAQPLQLEDWDKSLQKKEGDSTLSLYPAYPMWFSTRDMARIGYLMLRNGKWGDKQLIPKDWVSTITSLFSPFKEIEAYRDKNYKDFGYGYLWWVWDTPNNTGPYEGAYTAQGYFGQYITVLPALDLVIAHKTNDKYERATTNYFQILNKLLDANPSFPSQKKLPLATKKVNLFNKKPLLNQYTGLYQLPFGQDKILKVLLEQDRLKVLQLWSNRQEPISKISDSSFSTAVGTTLSFSRITNGKSENLSITERGTSFSAYRINPSDIRFLKAYEGFYYCAALQLNYKVVLKNNILYIQNSAINETFPLGELAKDTFRAKQQKFKFHYSAKSKNISGFKIETATLDQQEFVRKK